MFGSRRREEEFRLFIRELLLRFDETAREIRRRADQHGEELRLAREESLAYHERETKRLDELLAEGRAQREGFWRLLDRLDNGGTAPAG